MQTCGMEVWADRIVFLAVRLFGLPEPWSLPKTVWMTTGPKPLAFDENGLDCGLSEIVIAFQGRDGGVFMD